jgi:hypothetical protein
MRAVFILLIVLLIGLPQVCFSGSTAYGTQITCEKINRGQGKERDISVSNYVAGYISASNFHRNRSTSQKVEELSAWIIKYCKDNPSENIFNATFALDMELEKR